MVNWKTVLLIYILVLGLVSCQPNSNQVQNNFHTDSLESNQSIQRDFKITSNDIPYINLILNRGAFHWDAFELKGNELIYHPSKSGSIEGYPDYQKETSVRLSDSVVVLLINELIENSILEFDSIYENTTTCNSMLEIQLYLTQDSIQIKCADFERGCPEILTNLEEELIKLHGKGLKRILLPG